MDAGLEELGLRPGDPVRFRRTGRWLPATVLRRERDGSVALADADGATRSIRPEHIEVAVRSRRGATRWRPVLEHASTDEQLHLFG